MFYLRRILPSAQANLPQQMKFADETFDAVYAIEATVHAQSLEGVYREIYRTLKPGGVFGVYEWLMSDGYDVNNVRHREIRVGIEQGNGISNMVTIAEGVRAIQAAGFELVHHEDLAKRPDVAPWYYPIAGDFKYMQTLWDFPTIARMTKLGRGLVHKFVWGLEKVGIAPPGTNKSADNLALAADMLVEGAKQDLFTPMYLMVGRKPLNATN